MDILGYYNKRKVGRYPTQSTKSTCTVVATAYCPHAIVAGGTAVTVDSVDMQICCCVGPARSSFSDQLSVNAMVFRSVIEGSRAGADVTVGGGRQ